MRLRPKSFMHNIASQVDLQSAARQVMEEHGFQPDFPPQVNQQLSQILSNSNVHPDPGFRDLRSLLWSSIDNDTSRDLDQVEVAERLPGGGIKVLVGIADVDWLVPKATPIDLHAAAEGTTVYTGVENYSMLPEQLSTGLTSLLENEDRRAIVIDVRCRFRGLPLGIRTISRIASQSRPAHLQRSRCLARERQCRAR